MGLFTRALRPPPPDEIPNGNDPATAAPGTVGPPNVNPGDPHGVLVLGEDPPASSPPRIIPSAWSGYPADWWPPFWNGQNPTTLSETAWMCLDLNASVLSTMPPYLVDAPPSLNAEWLRNPDPDLYTSWEEFAKTLFWDYMLGEAFVIVTGYYSTGWPARFHVAPPWSVEVEIDAGRRLYKVGELDVTSRMLHIRYQSSVGDARGHGPLEVGGARMTASEVLQRYAMQAGDLIPSSILEAPEALPADQAEKLRDQWIAQRLAMPGLPAVLSGGLKWTPTALDPAQMGLVELSRFNESRIAALIGVPAFLVGLPSGGDSMTYSNVTSLFDHHWRAYLRPKATPVMAALSQWLLPRLTRVELNRDEYVQPGPYERAQTAQILAGIVDPVSGQQALTVQEIRAAERLTNTAPADLAAGVLR